MSTLACIVNTIGVSVNQITMRSSNGKKEQTGDQPKKVLQAIKSAEMIDLLKCSVKRGGKFAPQLGRN